MNAEAIHGKPAIDARSLRVAAALAVLWVLNAMDLLLTREAAARGTFVEANWLVAPWIHLSGLVVLYKVGLVAAGTAILFRMREKRQAEVGSWALVAVYAGVLCVWAQYYRYLEICLSDPATVRPPPLF